MNVGIGIKKLRKIKGITQVELSQLVGVTQTSISQIEMGEKSPHPDNLSKIAHALQVPASLLYVYGTEENDIPKDRKVVYNQLIPVIRGLIELIANDTQSQ